jgi:hypothetical protein
MFVYTARFSRRRAVGIVLLAAAILFAVILVSGRLTNSGNTSDSSLGAKVKNNKQRVEFLNSLGWDVDEEFIDEHRLTIPEKFSDVYLKYNALQLSQGFDLKKYAGREAVRYTYKINEHPSGDENVVADIIVCKNRVIAGDVQSCSPNGFMSGLRRKS